jgi:hypothetical protein
MKGKRRKAKDAAKKNPPPEKEKNLYPFTFNLSPKLSNLAVHDTYNIKTTPYRDNHFHRNVGPGSRGWCDKFVAGISRFRDISRIDKAG